MIFKASLFFLFTFAIFWGQAHGHNKDCKIEFVVQNEKALYDYHDTITVLIKVELNEDFCNDAAKVTKIFSKGLKIVERSDWKKMSGILVGQKVRLTVLKKEDQHTLTVYRKNAHYNCFAQKKFKIEN